MKKCSKCPYYYTTYFCSYESPRCKIYGSLDMDQKERHPDTAAASCKMYCGPFDINDEVILQDGTKIVYTEEGWKYK